MKKIIYVFRNDFRFRDNPALFSAAQEGQVIPLFVYDEEENIGEASKWWLFHTLESIKTNLKEMSSYLVVKKGKWVEEIIKLVNELEVDAVYWNESYDPLKREHDKLLMTALKNIGVNGSRFLGNILIHPEEIKTKNGTPFKVYTAFWKRLNDAYIQPPLPAVTSISSPRINVESTDINQLSLRSSVKWYEKLEGQWKVGEEYALDRFLDFFDRMLIDYQKYRDFPHKMMVSKLSPYLAFGQISSRFIYTYIKNEQPELEQSTESFLRELVWREFSQYLLYHFPALINEPLNEKFRRFDWNDDNENLERWKRGQTGYPFIDAGMRELWETGYMHNRVRMIVASFLTKHLLIPWQKGAAWFADTLLDADLANNSCSWQWVAGSGVDAQPYFRIFNPITQGKKFDEDGEYMKRWVPELKNIPPKYIHFPADAPKDLLKDCHVKLGEDYPFPIIEHKFARERALERYARIK